VSDLVKKCITVLTVLELWFLIPCQAALNAPPNIIVISLDTLRPDHLSFCGYKRNTAPNLSKLVEKSVLFTQAYSTSSFTLPAHGSLFTGLSPGEHGLLSWHSKLREDIPSLTEELNESGYTCAAFVVSPPLHSRYGFDRGFDLYDDYSHSIDLDGTFIDKDISADNPQYRVTSQNITRSAINWLRSAKAVPFFLFLHYFDIHAHYMAPGKYRNAFDPNYEGAVDGIIPNLPSQEYSKGLSKRDLEHLIALYDSEIAWVDHNIGQILIELKKLNLAETTAIVVISDHGEGFGEHELFGHGNSVYEEIVKILLLISWPSKLSHGKYIDTPVSVIQCYDTIRNMAGLAKKNKQISTLLEICENKNFSGSGPVWGSVGNGNLTRFFRMNDWKLIVNAVLGNYELFQLSEDPFERNNLAKMNPLIVKELHHELLTRSSKGEERSKEPEKPLPEECIRKIKALGYTD